MLYTQTVEAETLALIKNLMQDQALAEFNLAGGTALSLMIGHRKSIDIDLFTPVDFDAEKLATHLSTLHDTAELKTTSNTLTCFIRDIKVDILAHRYPTLNSIKATEGIRMFSLEDIAAMKVNAIYNSGSRIKDFVDIYFILEKIPLQNILESYLKKYPDTNLYSAKNALLYHEDIKKRSGIDFIGDIIPFNRISERLHQAAMHPTMIFKNNLRDNPDVNKIHKKQIRRGRKM